jgi:CHAT domain-containing protein/predicted negative regulator of RcsB-dependent stress response
MASPVESLPDSRVAELIRLTTDESRREFLVRNDYLVSGEAVRRIAELVVERIRVNTREALALADTGLFIAKTVDTTESLALGLRARANALYANGDNRSAVEHHDQAFRLYESIEDWKEAARTLSSSIQPLILVGEYDRAYKAAERAREIFTEFGETRRIASLENNIGNIYHRQDRFEEAIAHYERAYETLSEFEDWERVAIALHNMAMCLISLNDFPRSLECYRKSRELAERYEMPLLRDQADYNIAYLYYFRGEYSRAIEMLIATRGACEASGDLYHVALCYMDLSEIYLELNLSEDAREMAREGFERFEKLGMGYEAAKTVANQAIALGQQGKTVQALEQFGKAREKFAHENNPVWPWLLDLYQALLLFREGRYFEARRLCAGASAFFDQTILPGKAILAHLLLAQIALQVGEPEVAGRETEAALDRMEGAQTPVLVYQVQLLRGELALARGDRKTAVAAYKEASEALETTRSRLHSEELKISFVKNRLQVYETLVELYLANPERDISAAEAFGWIESSKSRSMTEMIFQSGQTLPLSETGQSELVRRIRDLREELNWYYHRIEQEQLRPEENSAKRLQQLNEKTVSHENELRRALRELPAQQRENAALEVLGERALERVQRCLPADAALIEYYSTGERLIAAVVTKGDIEIIPVSLVSRVLHTLHLFRFQISKFHMGAAYTQRFERPLLEAANAHLAELYSELIAPLEKHMSVRHLVFVPHGALHFLPFHALRSADQFLCDMHTVSYAPSATVFALSLEKTGRDVRNSLIMGIPDERAPEILTEIQSVAALVPDPRVFLGSEATTEVLRQYGSDTGLLHIATHGSYRQDNPMFSCIRMGDGYVNLYDLYQMRLPSRLVTLSGCATGMNFVSAGDELVGLERGLFCAGASSLLLSLWDVHDQSTATLMELFYMNYTATQNLAKSIQSAMLELREQKPHPYFWAPFALIGRID